MDVSPSRGQQPGASYARASSEERFPTQSVRRQDNNETAIRGITARTQVANRHQQRTSFRVSIEPEQRAQRQSGETARASSSAWFLGIIHPLRRTRPIVAEDLRLLE
jgi:hypothetical protein